MIARTLPLLFVPLVALANPDPLPTPSPSASPTATPAASPTPTSLAPVERLKDADVKQALDLIKEKFIGSEKLSDAAMQRALLEGLTKHLGEGATVVDTSIKSAKPEYPFLSEIIDSHIGYLRPGSVEVDVVPQIDASISRFKNQNVDAVILDLRGLAESGDFEAAAEMARRFTPKGKVLFSIQKPSAKQERLFSSNDDPTFSGALIVLLDAGSTGAAEALAGTLRLNAGAMIIGAEDLGGAAEYLQIPLSDGLAIRIAVGQVILPDIGPIFPNGLKPDLVVSMPPEVQQQIFKESKEKGVSQFIFENERRRLNEAALQANTNPEIDTAQAYQKDKSKSPAPRDVVLQRAVDLVTAIDFYKNRKPPAN